MIFANVTFSQTENSVIVEQRFSYTSFFNDENDLFFG